LFLKAPEQTARVKSFLDTSGYRRQFGQSADSDGVDGLADREVPAIEIQRRPAGFEAGGNAAPVQPCLQMSPHFSVDFWGQLPRFGNHNTNSG